MGVYDFAETEFEKGWKEFVDERAIAPRVAFWRKVAPYDADQPYHLVRQSDMAVRINTARIRLARESRGMTKVEAGNALSLTPREYRSWEFEAKALFVRPEILPLICKTFGYPAVFFVSFESTAVNGDPQMVQRQKNDWQSMRAPISVY